MKIQGEGHIGGLPENMLHASGNIAILGCDKTPLHIKAGQLSISVDEKLGFVIIKTTKFTRHVSLKDGKVYDEAN